MKRTTLLTIIIATVLTLSGCVKSVHGDLRGERIKVLLARYASELVIKGSERGGLLDIKRDRPGAITVNGKAASLPMRLYPKKEYLYINGRPFRGAVDVLDTKEGLIVVNEINIDSYIAGIINNEISSKWPEEVLKAQAVIARTYALHYRKNRGKAPYHVESSVMGQVYNGANTEDAAVWKAVRSTTGQILSYEGEPALTVYHSNAGGMTDSALDVWARRYPYLLSVKSPYDTTYQKLNWEYSITAEALSEGLKKSGFNIGAPVEAAVGSATEAGRVKALTFKDAEGGSATLSGEELRKILGYNNLKSAIFEVARDGDTFIFKGRGAGHGVGLSQWGAKGMAEDGYSYKEILKHYYPGTELKKTY